MIVALEETSPGGKVAGFGVAGDGGVAVDDEVAAGGDGGGVELGIGGRGG